MSDESARAISGGTGTFPSLQSPPSSVNEIAGGNDRPKTGELVPVARTAKADIGEIAAKLNKAIESIGRKLRFEVDLDSGHSVIQVLDRETGEVIRQIPPEQADRFLDGSGAVLLRLFDEQV